MGPIKLEKVQAQLDYFCKQPVYFHLETSNGSYAALADPTITATCCYLRNGKLTFIDGQITGEYNTYKVGLKLADGWLYAEGLTDWELTDDRQLLLGGYDQTGHLNIALELSLTPFPCGN